MTNEQIAEHQQQHATRLDGSRANLLRARSSRRAPFAIALLPAQLCEFVAESARAGLGTRPGIGSSMGYTIEELPTAGQVDVRREPGAPERMLTTLPGVGPHLAEILRDRLGVRSLEQLRDAVRAGKLRRAG